MGVANSTRAIRIEHSSTVERETLAVRIGFTRSGISKLIDGRGGRISMVFVISVVFVISATSALNSLFGREKNA